MNADKSRDQSGKGRLPGSLLNFLLRRNPWAPRSLARFAGQTLNISFKATGTEKNSLLPDTGFTITADGYLSGLDGGSAETPDVSITVPQEALPWFFSDRPRFFSAVSISGSAALAETVGQVFRNLRFGLDEIEDDLARLAGDSLVGDIVVHRLILTLRGLSTAVRRQGEALRENAREYLVEETQSLVGRTEFISFSSEIKALQGNLDRLEARLK